MPVPSGNRFGLLNRGTLIVFLVLLFWMECDAQSQFRFKHYEPEYSIGNNHTFQMAEDGLGFLWMVDYISVTKFDGYDFKTYIHDPGDTLLNLGHEPIGGFGYHEVLAVDRKGNLWINNASWHKTSKYLLRYDRNK